MAQNPAIARSSLAIRRSVAHPAARVSAARSRHSTVNSVLVDDDDIGLDGDNGDGVARGGDDEGNGGDESPNEVRVATKVKFLQRHVPITSWLPQYKGSYVVPDLIGGISVAAVIIGESLAYSILAGLPPAHGLYSCLVPVLLYAIFGTSHHLSVGPVPLSGVITGEALSVLNVEPQDAHHWGMALAFSTGIFLVIFAMLHFGFLENILAHPILEGFLTGTALTVIVGELPAMLGYVFHEHGEHAVTIYQKFRVFVDHTDLFNQTAMWLSIGSLVFQFSFKFLKSKFPKNPWLKPFPQTLVVIVLSIVIVGTQGWDKSKHLEVLGDIPSGPPRPIFPEKISEFRQLISFSILIALIGWIESVSVSRTAASEHSYHISANSEMLALGVSNIFGSFFQIMPVVGSIGRSQLLSSLGAVTQMACLFSAVIVFILTFFTSILFYFPKCVVSTIIVVYVYALVEVHALPAYVRMKQWRDLALWIGAFALTLLLGVEPGLIMSALVSVIYLLRAATQPHPVFLGQTIDEKTGQATFKVATADNGLRPPEHIGILRPASTSITFATSNALKKTIHRLWDHRGPSGGQLLPHQCNLDLDGGIIMDFSTISRLDSTAMFALKELAETAHATRRPFIFANLDEHGLRKCRDVGITHYIPTAFLARSTTEAVDTLERLWKEERDGYEDIVGGGRKKNPRDSMPIDVDADTNNIELTTLSNAEERA